MKKLFKNKKGFTLMEMLIVVAIIVILVAVSMPVFTSQLEKSRKAADDANVRATKAVATAEYLMNDKTGSYVYDALAGKIYESSTDEAKAIKVYGQAGDREWLNVTIAADGTISAVWNKDNEL